MAKILGSFSGMRKYLEKEMLAVLDRRIGKRTLKKLKETVDSQPAWLAKIYRLRLDAEKI